MTDAGRRKDGSRRCASLVMLTMLTATEAVEHSLVAQWTLHPKSAPTDAPDLSASRSAIDALNQEMLTAVAANWDLLHSPECAAQLGAARTDIERRLDGPYQQALSSATQYLLPAIV